MNMGRTVPAFSVSLKFLKQKIPNVKSGTFPLLGFKKIKVQIKYKFKP
jgi:hypothetical protein